jgi:hypothetical protein
VFIRAKVGELTPPLVSANAGPLAARSIAAGVNIPRSPLRHGCRRSSESVATSLRRRRRHLSNHPWRIVVRVPVPITSDRPIEGLRQRRCCDPACNTLFTICASCDRGQRYCSDGCRKRTRQQQLRASGRRYQASAGGRHNHSQRQQSYRRRRCQPGVTHQVLL